MKLHTTEFKYSSTIATDIANSWSEAMNIDGTDLTKPPYNWRKEYNTTIKGEPLDSRYPDECWAVTNRFDPRVARGK